MLDQQERLDYKEFKASRALQVIQAQLDLKVFRAQQA
jgi:hypothetical protein